MCHFVISRVIPSFSAANSSMILNVLLLTITLCTVYARFHPDIHGRIIGGRDGDIKDHPYLISLVADGSSFCGAGLIHPQWALTSAHCMEHLKVEELTIRANSTYWEKGLAMTVKQIFSHPDFRHPTGDSDIALIQLSSPINCTYCKIISLSKTVPRKGEIGHIAGWGVTVVTSMDPWPVLQVADIPVVDFKECDESYTMISQPLTENMFCAGNIQEGGIDSCSGDSGGPLVINDTLVGLVSWGHNCALPAFPGVYTLVPKFLKWIKDISGVSVN